MITGKDESDTLAVAMRALAHPKRLRLLRELVVPHSIEECASALGIARQSAQEHVDQLVEVGLLEPRRGRGDHGPVTQYVAALPRLFDVYDQLGQRAGILAEELDERVHAPARTVPLSPAAGRAPPDDIPRLTIVHGLGIGRTMQLDGAGPWLIGRDPQAPICLDYDPYVSTKHAEVQRATDGFVVVDLFSSNGTYLDWTKLARGAREPLRSGSLVRAGRTLLLFRAPARA